MAGISDTIRYQFRMSDTVVRLIIVNVSVFAVLRVINAVSWLFLHPVLELQTVSYWLAVPAGLDRLLFRPWTLFTYMFLHWDLQHVLLNMIWLYWFGRILQEYLGAKRLLATYLMGGLSGACLYILSYNLIPLFAPSLPAAMAMGASASIMAITIAAATLLPDYRISLLFIGEVKLKWLALAILLIDLINISSSNAGGHISHLGGALYGFIFIRMLQKGTDLSAGLQRLFSTRPGNPRMRTVHRSERGSDNSFLTGKKDRQQRLDEILDKISRTGYDSLSKEEREFLFRASNDQG